MLLKGIQEITLKRIKSRRNRYNKKLRTPGSSIRRNRVARRRVVSIVTNKISQSNIDYICRNNPDTCLISTDLPHTRVLKNREIISGMIDGRNDIGLIVNLNLPIDINLFEHDGCPLIYVSGKYNNPQEWAKSEKQLLAEETFREDNLRIITNKMSNSIISSTVNTHLLDNKNNEVEHFLDDKYRDRILKILKYNSPGKVYCNHLAPLTFSQIKNISYMKTVLNDPQPYFQELEAYLDNFLDIAEEYYKDENSGTIIPNLTIPEGFRTTPEFREQYRDVLMRFHDDYSELCLLYNKDYIEPFIGIQNNEDAHWHSDLLRDTRESHASKMARVKQKNQVRSKKDFQSAYRKIEPAETQPLNINKEETDKLLKRKLD